MMPALLMMIFSYFIGSIPFSYILPAIKGVDVRKVGSGNVGGTNALRAAGPFIGALSILTDAFKALIMVMLARVLGINVVGIYFTGVFTVIGHDYPIYLKFVGGKGVACTLGFVFAINPWMGVEFVFIWFLIALSTRYVSLASIVGLLVLTLTAILTKQWNFSISIAFLTALSIYRHKANIRRLLNANENKMDILKSIKELFGGNK